MRISVLYGAVTANCVLCTEETKEIQVVSEEELQRDSLALPKEPGREQEVEGDRQVGGKGNGEPGELGQIPQVPAALLASQENQEAEGPERDQLVIRDGWRGPSGLRWVWRNGRGPHLEGRHNPEIPAFPGEEN